MKMGVNFFGSWETADGIGRAAALNIQCLHAAGVPLDTFVLSRPVAPQSGRDTVIDDHLISTLRHKINLFNFDASWVPHYFARVSEGALNGFYNIGYWFCEVPKMPDYWARQAHLFDEIWTASSFCQMGISRSSNVPVIRIPLAIETREKSKRIQSHVANESSGVFTFLFIFNAYSDAERKNVLFTIRAFLEAHAGSVYVRLIIKASNLEHDAVLAEKLDLIRQHHANVEVIDGYVGNDIVQALYDQADVYVSLHRAEGFGLTISDAMSRGIPVIVTGYSGNMDFCEASDTRLVAYKLRFVGHERLRYRRDDVWAEPDMDDAIAAFKELVVDYPIWLQKAARARGRIAKAFSVGQVGSLMQERLAMISSNFSFVNDMEDRGVERDVGVFETYGF